METQREIKLAAFCPDPNCKGDCNYANHAIPKKKLDVYIPEDPQDALLCDSCQ